MSTFLLALETSVETGSVALCRDGKVVQELTFPAGRKPSATLWPALERVMAQVEALSTIVVGVGPGSYNGSRIGIAAAQGIALVHDCGVAPVCSFEGVATSTARALAIGDARRGTFSLQNIEAGRTSGPFELVDQVPLAECLRLAIQDSIEVFSFDSKERFPVASELREHIHTRTSQASLLARSFLSRSPEEQARLLATPAEPRYLRAPHITVGKRKSLLER